MLRLSVLFVVDSVDEDVWHRAGVGGLLGGHSPIMGQVPFGAKLSFWMSSIHLYSILWFSLTQYLFCLPLTSSGNIPACMSLLFHGLLTLVTSMVHWPFGAEHTMNLN